MKNGTQEMYGNVCNTNWHINHSLGKEMHFPFLYKIIHLLLRFKKMFVLLILITP